MSLIGPCTKCGGLLAEDEDNFAMKLERATGMRQYTCLGCAYEVLVLDGVVYPSTYLVIEKRLRELGRSLFEDDEELDD